MFARILAGLAAEEPEENTAMIDATYLKTPTGRRHKPAPEKKGGVGA